MRSMMLRVSGMAVVLGAVASSGLAQTLQQRIDNLRHSRAQQSVESRMERLNIQARLRDLVDPVDIADARLKTALQWYSATTGIPVVIDWRAMELEGVDPEQPITIQMRHVPAGQLLSLMMRMAAPEGVTLMYETSPWYVQIMTKRQADKDLIVRVYEVGDLLMDIPNFTNAPQFDLNEALSNTNSGGSNQGGSSNAGLFGDNEQPSEMGITREERGAELAQLIRDTVEPDVWMEHGGNATIRYHGNRLVVSAPRYVHAKIGMPVISIERDANLSTMSAYPAARPRAAGGSSPANAFRGGVSGVQRAPSSSVSGVSE